jgi:transcriptional regulator
LPPDQTNLPQGILDMMILKALALGELHGLGVSRRIEQITKGTFQVKPGSLFPALHRMEEQGWIVASWGESKNKRHAKYYKLTNLGRPTESGDQPLGPHCAGDNPDPRSLLKEAS